MARKASHLSHDFYVYSIFSTDLLAYFPSCTDDEAENLMATWKIEPGQVKGVFTRFHHEPEYAIARFNEPEYEIAKNFEMKANM